MPLGAYAIERDYSHYVAHAAKTIFAVVSTATRGPVGVATLCTSAQDLANKFGPINPTCLGLYAGQYFLSQSSRLYFVRAASDSAKAASVVISGKGANDTAVTDAITVTMKEKGTYFNDYTLSVTEVTDQGVITYTLTLRNKSGALIEILKGLTLENITSLESKYFTISANTTATTIDTTTSTPSKFTGGDDGIEDIEAADYINAANALIPSSVDMNLFAIPGVSEAAVITAMLSIAENRGDCLYLVDPPKGLDRDGVADWHNGKTPTYEHAAFNSSYGALYYDWVRIYDSVNKVYVDVPPSVSVAAAIAYSDRISECWFAPAGVQRGILRGVIDSVTPLGKSDAELLYTGDNNINPIIEDPQHGLIIWGQKTLLRADTALNRVNVRRLMNYLKRVVTAACDYMTFEPNDRHTWNKFEGHVQPVLERIKNNRGIYNYQIIKGETIITDTDIDNYKMPCMIMIRPTKAAEEIPIYFTITSTGADFNEVLESNGIITE